MNYLDWARLDLAALLDLMSPARATSRSGWWVTPMAAMPLAFSPDASGSSVSRHSPPARDGMDGCPPASVCGWCSCGVFLVLMVRAKGYLNWSMLGMGEDLPGTCSSSGVAGANCRATSSTIPSSATSRLSLRMSHSHSRHQCHGRQVGTAASRDAFMSAYANADLERITIEPRDIGMKAIGHMDYFRPAAIALWQETLACVRQGKAGPAG